MRLDESLSLKEFVAILKGLPEMTLRMALTKAESEDSPWLMQSLVLKVAPDAPIAVWKLYNYGRIIFVANRIPCSEIAQWLEDGRGQIAGLNFEVPEFQEQVRAERFPSHARYHGFDGLWQPHTYYELNTKSGRFDPPRENIPLIQEDCPSFPSLGVAVYKLLYDLDIDPDRSFPSITVSLRVAHTEAWIERLEQHSSSLVIRVLGEAVEGVRLEVTGSKGVRLDQKLVGPGDIRFELPEGLPPRLWVLLSRGNRWLDIRDLNQHGLRSSWDNVIDVPPDLATQVAGLVARGEGERTEFKVEIPQGNDKFLNVVAAFANGEGGMIIVGVVNGTGEIKGLTCDANKLKDRLSQMIRAKVFPEPKIKIESCELEGRKLLAIIVEEGERKPYGVGSDSTKLSYYVRRTATTPPARQEDINAMVSNNNSKVQSDSYWNYQ